VAAVSRLIVISELFLKGVIAGTIAVAVLAFAARFASGL